MLVQMLTEKKKLSSANHSTHFLFRLYVVGIDIDSKQLSRVKENFWATLTCPFPGKGKVKGCRESFWS